MAQSFYPITPVEVTPGTAGSWQEVNAATYGVPVGATGVLLHYVNKSSSLAMSIGFRKNGSTDNRHDPIDTTGHAWAAIGIDANRIFEAWVGSATDVDVFLVGYTTSGVTFFTNAYDKTPSCSFPQAWEDIDCSSECPNAIGLIFEIQGGDVLEGYGLRRKGSTDDITGSGKEHCQFAAIIGCDSNQVCQGILSADVGLSFYLIGYITTGCVFNTNATDLSLGSTGSWLDLSALPSGAIMGFIEVKSALTYDYGLRKNGSSEDIYGDAARHPWGIVECDDNQLIEGKIGNTDLDFFLIGYAEETQHYDRSYTALLGLLPSASRANSFTRSNAVLLGLLPIKSRGIALNRTKTTLLGLKGIGSRAITLTRTDTALLGLKAIASHTAFLRVLLTEFGRQVIEELDEFGRAVLGSITEFGRIVYGGRQYTRIYTALLGLLTSASRTVELSRTNTALLGLKTITSRTLNLTKSETVLLGLKATASWNRFYLRTYTVLLGLKATASRSIVLSRADTALLGLKATATRAMSLTRLHTALLGLKATATRSTAFSRTQTVLLGLKVTASTSWQKFRKLTIRVVTAQYRAITIITSQYRVIKVVTTLKRKIKTLLSGG
jgi:hypothetical protein